MLRNLPMLVVTAFRLGFINVMRVIAYRALKRSGAFRRQLPRGTAVPVGWHPGDDPSPPWPGPSNAVAEADEFLSGHAFFFSVHRHSVGSPPDWLLNPFTGKCHPRGEAHWSEIGDFAAAAGDIKITWELSRFSWAPVLARASRLSGQPRYAQALEAWLQDWWKKNPPNMGPQWMCAQETSFRLLNTLLALRILGVRDGDAGMSPFVEAHCRRIAATTFYAIAQDNNHGTSEAAALFVAGHWLLSRGGGDDAERWAARGRRMLEERARRLILGDGTFAQHSTTYHRVVLDTFSVVESWRRAADVAPLSSGFYEKAAAATRWLGAMVDPSTGDAPNLGANDGALPFRLDSQPFRDFRPSLQLASVLFLGQPALDPGPWDEPSHWLGVEAPKGGRPWPGATMSQVLGEGGYAVLRNAKGARAVIRAPSRRFRPPHGDALHLDLWWKGRNLLRDGGTYSYAESQEVAVELASVTGHNTAQFDDRDQMRRIGRFLYGDWIKVQASPVIANAGADTWTGSYQDHCGARHERRVTLADEVLEVEDRIDGFRHSATLRWRLAPGDWALESLQCASSLACVGIESDVPAGVALVRGTESRHYLERSELPVLEVRIARSPARIVTRIALR